MLKRAFSAGRFVLFRMLAQSFDRIAKAPHKVRSAPGNGSTGELLPWRRHKWNFHVLKNRLPTARTVESWDIAYDTPVSTSFSAYQRVISSMPIEFQKFLLTKLLHVESRERLWTSDRSCNIHSSRHVEVVFI